MRPHRNPTSAQVHWQYSRLNSLPLPAAPMSGMMYSGRMPLRPISAEPSSENTHGVYSNCWKYDGTHGCTISV